MKNWTNKIKIVPNYEESAMKIEYVKTPNYIHAPVQVNYLKPLCFSDDGVVVLDEESIRSQEFERIHKKVYGEFKPGKNAANKLCRGIRWGVRVPNYEGSNSGSDTKYSWTNRSSYSLSEKLNPEEKGRIREFNLIPNDYLEREEVIGVMEKVFNTLFSNNLESEKYYAHEVQLSAIRYEPTIAATALPSPLIPHQDQVSGGIALMAKTLAIEGGLTRVYKLCEMPVFELDLNVGNIFVIDDERWLHQVTPIQVAAPRSCGERQYRDVLLVRFERISRT